MGKDYKSFICCRKRIATHLIVLCCIVFVLHEYEQNNTNKFGVQNYSFKMLV